MLHQQPRLELRRDVERPHWRIRAFWRSRGLRRRNFVVGYKDEMTLKQARQKRLELLAKINRGDMRDSNGMTFRELVAKFLELRMPTLKASTQGFYRQHMDHHLLPFFGDYSLERIGRLQVEQFAAKLSKLAWSTRKGVVATLSTILDAAVEWRLMEYNAARGIRLGQRTARYEKAVPSPEQFRAIVDALDDNLGLLVTLLAVTGIRISEALALRWSDLNWERETVMVQRRLYRETGLDSPKTPASVRPRWIGPIADALRMRRPESDGYIFSIEGDERSVLRKHLRPVLRRLGLPVGCGWHAFRRLHTSLLQAVGGSGLEVSRLVGHTDQAMTARYTVLSPGRETELVSGVYRQLTA